jgi:hypothetical protein
MTRRLTSTERYDIYRQGAALVEKTKPQLFEKISKSEKAFERHAHRIFYGINSRIANSVRDKFIFNTFATALGVPTPELVGLYARGRIIKPGSWEALPLRRFIDDLAQPFFVKCRNGKGGRGSFLVAKPGRQLHMNGRTASMEEVMEAFHSLRETDALVERVVEQHSSMAALYPSAVNTVRLITSILRGSAEVVTVAIRMGCRGAVVDNVAAGGIYAGIVGERIVAPALDKQGNAYEKHPDTDVALHGRKIPFLDEAFRICVRLHEYLSFPTIGWDVAIGPESPVLLEANTYWDPVLHRGSDPDYIYRLTADWIASRRGTNADASMLVTAAAPT